MPNPTNRRRVLLALPAALAGCTGSDTDEPADTTEPDDGSGGSNGDTTGTSTPTPTPTDGMTPPTDDETPDPAEEVECLPDPSPLATILVEFLQAEDRHAFADDRGIPFEDGRVHVQVELVEGGELPASLVGEVTTAYDPIRNAWIPVANLVDVALDDDVRIVRPIPEARTH